MIRSKLTNTLIQTIFVLSTSALISLSAGQITVMSYNVENLFDTINDPRVSDDEFTPGGKAEWTEEKLKAKLEHLGHVVTAVKNEDGTFCPTILGLVEVENRAVLEFWKKNYLAECNYTTTMIHDHGSGPVEDDRRGIKVALLSKLPLQKRFPDDPEEFLPHSGGRYILEAQLRLNGMPLIVLVNHWKSRIGDGAQKRLEAGKVLRTRFEFWNQVDPQSDIIAMGDFNDEPEDVSFLNGARVQDDLSLLDDDLNQAFIWNTSFDSFNLRRILAEAKDANDLGDHIDLGELERLVRQKRGSYYFKRDKKFNQLDSILVSRGLLNSSGGFKYIAKTFKVVRPLGFVNVGGAPIPFGTQDDGIFGGASDHFPVLVRLNY